MARPVLNETRTATRRRHVTSRPPYDPSTGTAPENHEHGQEAVGAGAGALGGAAVGMAVGGPVGAAVGGAIGAVGGAVAGEATEGDDEAGSGAGGRPAGSPVPRSARRLPGLPARSSVARSARPVAPASATRPRKKPRSPTEDRSEVPRV